MKYSSITIWYFSGTGNAQFGANTIASVAKGEGCAVTINKIAKNIDPNPIDNNSNPLLGFCFPTHGFNAPPIVLNFLLKFPRGRNRVFIINTRAGMKLYKIHTPGIGGLALWLPAAILWFKGYKPIGFRPLDMPSNWISIHPGLKTKVVESIKANCEETLDGFTKRIISGRTVLNGLLWLPIDIVLIPISLLYYLFGRFALAKTFIASYKCNNCGLCIKQCPVGAITDKSGRPFWTFKCESCMKCMNSCPERAIQTPHSFTILLFWAAFSFFPTMLFRLLFELDAITPKFYSDYYSILNNTSKIAVGFLVLFFGYNLLHQLLRVRIFNKLITFTSLTHYKFWRRYRLSSSGEIRRIKV
jgi:ferredoxin